MTKSRFAPPFHGSHYAGTSYVLPLAGLVFFYLATSYSTGLKYALIWHVYAENVAR